MTANVFCLLLTNKGPGRNEKLGMMLPGLAEGDEGKGPEGLGHVDIGDGSEFFEVISEVALCNRLGHPKFNKTLFNISHLKSYCDPMVHLSITRSDITSCCYHGQGRINHKAD